MVNLDDHLWGIILAAGEGKRLNGFIQRLYGEERPKQYCTIVGTRSLLRHTLDRVKLLIKPENLLTIINRNHVHYASEHLNEQPPNTIIAEPCSRETGPGVLLPLVRISRHDSASCVAVFPSDHFIVDEKQFMEYILHAATFVRTHPEFIVVLGVHPDYAETEFGWIEKGRQIIHSKNRSVDRINRFWEKPNQDLAKLLLSRGCLWNTHVLVGQTSTFLELYKELLPEVFSAFEIINNVIGSAGEEETTRNVFSSLPSISFSRSILARAPHHFCVMDLRDVYWSDWGEEHRIKLDVKRFKLRLHESGANKGRMLQPGCKIDS